MIDTLLDAAEIALSTAYAAWLYQHKEHEPDMTWAEVTAGVAYTLAFAHMRGALHGGDWRDQSGRVFREFFISAPPIVVGELIQRYEARRALRALPEERAP